MLRFMTDQGSWQQPGNPPGGYLPPQGQPQPQFNPYAMPPPGMAGGYPPPAQRPVNGLAIAALVCGIVPTAVVAIGLGIGALVQIGNRGERGKGMAITGIVLGSLWTVFIVLGVVGAALDPEPTGSGAHPTRPPAGSQQRDVRKLNPGDCTTQLNESDNVSGVPVVPCTKPHRDEVYANIPIEGSKYPGVDQVQTTANTVCGDALDKLVGSDKIPDGSNVFFLYPTSTSWVLGDHSVTCLLELPADRSGRLLPNG
jgi:Domain of unknown function (DUF4190)/Septum formation